ncbi:Apoptosis regulator Bcl-2 [Channa argus]|uniref:Apoptosis regulator Bcl-2 n=1 Tax=Channa argus TaxID=215402 RepID=A0A6G1QNY5_CHAAH|nr:Apoptosis regulator Bcl-2 [Channa argus]KAK2886842.1 hypothetical protein Q8A73_020788 [Channa argus]
MAAYTTRDMVEDYLRYKLLTKGVAWRMPPPPREASSSLSWRSDRARTSPQGVPTYDFQTGTRLAPPRVQVTLRCAGDELERRFGGDLSAHVLALLQCGDGSSVARRWSLTRVREELFRDGLNWGRIVAMMELGGALSAKLARTEGVGQVDDIARWLEESLDLPLLQGWIEENGGWDAFVELYGDSKPPVGFWSLRMMFGLAILGAAGITLGALFSQK